METKRQKEATLEVWEHQRPCSVLPSMWLLIWGTCTPVAKWKVTETFKKPMRGIRWRERCTLEKGGGFTESKREG